MTDEQRKARQRERHKIYWEKNKEKLRDRREEYRQSVDRRKRLLYSIKWRAKKRGMAFTLTVESVLWPSHCPILGMALNYKSSNTVAPDGVSLDRIDSSRGYTPDNVFVCSFRANTLKSDARAEELRAIAQYMELYL